MCCWRRISTANFCCHSITIVVRCCVVAVQVISRGHEDADGSSSSSDRHMLPNPIPASLLLHLLSSGALQPLPPPQQQQQQQQQQEHATDSIDDYTNADYDNEVSKRVFCNGFTGCGGRHRDRRHHRQAGKRLIPVLVKRPFCNSFGCYNGKRSPKAFPLASVVAAYRARMLAQTLAAGRREEGAAGGVPGKRLFCNGYGGCRGGKRSLFSPWMSKMNSVADGLR